ncbi:MAG: TldD/PmbA family protein [Erysipelotrichaceae bacterium]|nr:TldD/PmbA family protein [Erysipelotrichaceae bacterium]
MLEKHQLKEILSLCVETGGDFAEIFEEKKISHSLSLLNGEVEKVNSGMTYGAGIRIYHGTESVYAFSNDTSLDNLKKMAKNLAASFDDEKKDIAFELEEVVYDNQHPILKDPCEVAMEKKMEVAKQASKGAMEYDELIKKVMVSYLDEKQEVAISNTNGKYIRDTRIRTRLSTTAIAMDGEEMETGFYGPGASKGFEFYDEINPYEAGKEAARIAKTLLRADLCPSGTMPVVIDNGFGGVIFHEACGHSLEASSVAKGQSVFAGKLGQQIAGSKVSAVDDATITNAWGSANIDDEGNFTKRNLLIENGILKSYLVDTLNGRRMNTPSTSSSRRQSYKFETTSRMSNTFILNGEDTLEDMIASMEYGLYCKSMSGGSVNPSTGDFNFAVQEGYLVEHGQIVKPVKGASLIGNGGETLMKIDMVGTNLKRAQGMCGASSGSIPTDVGQPAIRVSSMIVGGRG